MGLFGRRRDEIISPTQAPSLVRPDSLSGASAPPTAPLPGTASSPDAAPLPGAAPAPQAMAAQVPDAAAGFVLEVQDVFSITGRGVVVVGQVAQGMVRVGDTVTITPNMGAPTATIAGIEKFRKRLTQAGPGDAVGLLLRGVTREHVQQGTVISAARQP